MSEKTKTIPQNKLDLLTTLASVRKDRRAAGKSFDEVLVMTCAEFGYQGAEATYGEDGRIIEIRYEQGLID